MQLFGLGLGPLLALLAGAGALTIALYMLRLSRTRVAVPFLPLWEGLLRERQSSRLFARLRHLVSLLIALTIAALLALALGDPRPRAQLLAARHALVLIDAGLSMQAHDVAPNRLHVAKARARAIAQAAGPGLQLMIAQMDTGAAPLSTFDGDARELTRAIDRVEPTELATDYQRAYRFALDALRGRSRPEIVVISDAPEPPSPELAAQLQRASIRVRHEPVGVRGRDVAITQFASRRYPLDKNRSELLLQLANHSAVPARVELTLLGDGAVIDVQQLTLEAGATTQRVYDDVTGVSRTLEARIAAAPGQDDLAIDDRAYAVLAERRRIKVLCVGDGNRYLEAALLLDEYLDVDRVAATDYRGARGYDAVIFDRFVPPVPPAAPAFYIAPHGSGDAQPLQVDGTIERPFFDKLERAHPLVRFVALRDVNIASALHVRPAPGDVVLGGDARGPLLIAGERGGRRFAALTFDPGQSDLPLRAAWPLLLLNVIDWFAAGEHSDDAPLAVGETRTLALPGGVTSARVRAPDGSEQTLPVAGTRLALTPLHAGLYRVSWDGGERLFAANIDHTSRRALAPVARLSGAGIASEPAELSAPAFAHAPWAVLLGLALLLLTAEWITYHRRWTV